MGLNNSDYISFEGPEWEPQPTDIAYACQGILHPDICQRIATEPDSEVAMQIACTELVRVNQDPQTFLSERGFYVEGPRHLDFY